MSKPRAAWRSASCSPRRPTTRLESQRPSAALRHVHETGRAGNPHAPLALLRQTFTANAEAAKQLLAVGESKPDPQLAPAELAAWTSLASILLNLDETISKE